MVGDAQDGPAPQHVEAFFIGVDVRRQRAARRQLVDAEAGMDRFGGVVDQRRVGVAVAVTVIDRMATQGRGVEMSEMMHVS